MGNVKVTYKKTTLFYLRLFYLIVSLIALYFTFNANGLFVLNFLITGYFSYLLLLSVKTLIKN